MRSVRLLLATAVAAGIVVVGGAGAAHACSCAILPPADQLAGSDLVFTGTATDAMGVGSTTNVAWYRFEVDEVFKGQAAAELELRTPSQSAACGPDFEVDRRYLVYVTRWQGHDTTSSCSGNVADPRPAMLARRFGPGEPPDAGVPVPPERRPDVWTMGTAYGNAYRRELVAGVVVLGLLAVGGVAAVLRRSPQAPG